MYDPDYCPRATEIRNYYYGYPHVFCFEHHEHFAYKTIYDYGPGGYRQGVHDMHDWCKANASDKWRCDMLRVMKAPSTGNQWSINELGGGDYWFFAFKDPEDMFVFQLRWA